MVIKKGYLVVFLSLLFSLPLFAERYPVMLQLQTDLKIEEDFRDGVEEVLTTLNYSLVDQNAQKQALKEQADQRKKACYDDECLVDTGKMLAAKGLIVVEVSDKGSDRYRFKARFIDFETGTTTKTKVKYYEGKLTQFKKLYQFGKELTKDLFSNVKNVVKDDNKEIDKNVKKEPKQVEQKQQIIEPRKEKNGSEVDEKKEVQLLLYIPKRKHSGFSLSLALTGHETSFSTDGYDSDGNAAYYDLDGAIGGIDIKANYRFNQYFGFYFALKYNQGVLPPWDDYYSGDQDPDFTQTSFILGVHLEFMFGDLPIGIYSNMGAGWNIISLDVYDTPPSFVGNELNNPPNFNATYSGPVYLDIELGILWSFTPQQAISLYFSFNFGENNDIQIDEGNVPEYSDFDKIGLGIGYEYTF